MDCNQKRVEIASLRYIQFVFVYVIISYLKQVLIKIATAFLTDDWFVTMWIFYCDVVQILSPNEFDDYSFRFFFTNCEKFQIVTKTAKCYCRLQSNSVFLVDLLEIAKKKGKLQWNIIRFCFCSTVRKSLFSERLFTNKKLWRNVLYSWKVF